MMLSYTLLVFLLITNVLCAPTLEPKAVVPTSAGQVGVNLVDFVQTDSPDYLVIEGVTKWKGGYTDIVEIKTDIQDGTTVLATKTRQIDVATATADADGVVAGDLHITLSPAGKANIEGIFKEAQKSCTVESEFGTCAIGVIKRGLAASPEITAGLEGGVDVTAVAEDLGGLANLVKYLEAAEDAVLTASTLENTIRALVAAFMSALRAFIATEAFPILALAVMMMFTAWVAAKTMPVKVKIPWWMNKPHPTRTPSIHSISTTTSYSTVYAQFMTDHYHARETSFDEIKANAVANALAIRFSSMEARVTGIPKLPTCIKRIVKDCLFELESKETAELKACPEFPELPPACTTPDQGNEVDKHTIGQAFVIWEVPLKGRYGLGTDMLYSFHIRPFRAPDGSVFLEQISAKCGVGMFKPNITVVDPHTAEYLSGNDPGYTGPGFINPRRYPGRVKMADIAGGKNCSFEQNPPLDRKPAVGAVFCDNDNFVFGCEVPTQRMQNITMGREDDMCRDHLATHTTLVLWCKWT